MDAVKIPLNSVVGDFVVQRSTLALNGAAQHLVGAAPDRCLLWVGCLQAAGSTVIDIVPPVSSTTGIPLGNNIPPFLLNSRDHPGVIWQDWYVFGMGLSTLVVLEVFYRPRG